MHLDNSTLPKVTPQPYLHANARRLILPLILTAVLVVTLAVRTLIVAMAPPKESDIAFAARILSTDDNSTGNFDWQYLFPDQFSSDSSGVSTPSLRRPPESRVTNLTAKSRSLAANRYNWVLAEEQALFSPRYAHAAVINNRQEIFVIGGAVKDVTAGKHSEHTHGYLNDVWKSSAHGRNWEVVVPRSVRFSPRRGHAAVMNANGVVIFVLGGFCGKDCFMNDLWNSETGSVWNNLGNAPWSARHGHAAVITSKENLIVLGGHNGNNYLGDIWSIQDPAQALVYSVWKQVTKQAAWSPRYGHAVVINSFDELFVMGGFFANKLTGRILCFNDVWRSTNDGYSWASIVEHAAWSGRYQHAAVVGSDDQIFILGGLDDYLERRNDVWRSEDSGRSWNLVTAAASWSVRYEHAVVTDLKTNSMYIIGGMNTGAMKFNDVWRSERTCSDGVDCGGDSSTCRDGTMENFERSPNPQCVDICDRRIFDDCEIKEGCRVLHGGKTHCIDPCVEQECSESEVCEVAARGTEWKKKDRLTEATPYCLACSNAKTKYACDKLRQCHWSPASEVCQMRCSVTKSKKQCLDLAYCKYEDDTCTRG